MGLGEQKSGWRSLILTNVDLRAVGHLWKLDFFCETSFVNDWFFAFVWLGFFHNLCVTMEPIQSSIHLIIRATFCVVPIPKPVWDLPHARTMPVSGRS